MSLTPPRTSAIHLNSVSRSLVTMTKFSIWEPGLTLKTLQRSVLAKWGRVLSEHF